MVTSKKLYYLINYCPEFFFHFGCVKPYTIIEIKSSRDMLVYYIPIVISLNLEQWKLSSELTSRTHKLHI